MYRRLHAMVCVIPLACLILSNMVFLVGLPPVKYYIYKIFYKGDLFNLLFILMGSSL